MTTVIQPFPFFADLGGDPLDEGYIYIGLPNQNPETSPKQAYWDEALTIPATQPLRTLEGYIARNGAPARVFVNGDFSLTVRNKRFSLVYTVPDIESFMTPSELAAYLALPGASAGIGFIQEGDNAVTRTAEDKMRERISIEDFGGVGDGVTNNNTAFLRLLNALLKRFLTTGRAATGYFPAGVYLITLNNPFGQINLTTLPDALTFRFYLGFCGDGHNSIIHWKPATGASDAWLYDSLAVGGNNRLINPLFKDLQFWFNCNDMNSGQKMHGFRVNGILSVPSQSFMFENVRVEGVLSFATAMYPSGPSAALVARMGTFLRTEGTVNADRNKFNWLRVVGLETLLDIGPNAESVVHVFVDCDADQMFGDIFKGSGGASLEVHGGSYTMWSQGTTKRYLLAIRPQSSPALAGTYNFYGIRTELNPNFITDPSNNYAHLLLTDATAQPNAYQSSYPKINFFGCNLYPDSGPARDTIEVDAALPAKIMFWGCALRTQYQRVRMWTSRADLRTVSPGGPFAEVSFEGGEAIPFSQVSWANANTVGRVSARNVSAYYAGGVADNSMLDYDLTNGTRGIQTGGHSLGYKCAALWGPRWPDAGDNAGMSVTLPPGAIIKEVMFHKAAGGVSSGGANYRLSMVDGNANVYAQSTLADQNVSHTAAATVNTVADTINKQVVFLLCLGGNTGTNQGIAMRGSDYALVYYV